MARARRVRVLITALIIAVSAWGSVVAVCSAQADAAPVAAPDRVKLYIPTFRKVAGGDRFSPLEASFPVAMRMALFPYEWLDIVTGPDLSPGPDDWILSGTFIELGGDLRILSTLRSGTREKQLSSTGLSDARLLESMNGLASEVVSALSQLNATKFRARSIGVGCWESRSKDKGRPADGLARDLTAITVDQLRNRRGVRVVTLPPEKCGAGPRGSESEQLDARVGGAVSVADGRTTTIAAEVLIEERQRRLLVPILEGRVEDYFQLRQNFANLIGDFFDAILGARGEWEWAADIDLLGGRSDAESYVEYGRKFFEAGDNAKAAVFLLKAAERRPSTEAYHLLGLSRIRQKRFDEAASELEKARDSATAQRELGRVYLGLRRPREALGAFERARRLDPTLVDIELEIGDTYAMRMGREGAADATRYYELAAVRDPKDPAPYHRLAILAQQKGPGGSDEVIALLRRSLAVQPNYATAQRALAAEYSRRATRAMWTRDYEGAVREHSLEIELVPTAGAHLSRAIGSARAAAAVGATDFTGAIEDYRTAMALVRSRPTSGAPPLEWSMLGLAEALILAGRYSEAEVEIQDFLSLNSREQKVFVPVGHFLSVVARILSGAGDTVDEENVRRQIQEGRQETPPRWSFDLLESVVQSNGTIGDQKRKDVLRWSGWTRRALTGDK